MPKEDRVEFQAPKGVIPEDIETGDTFDLVSTYRLKPGGEICLVQMGDVKMPGYDEDEYEDKNKETRAGYGNVMDSMHSAMGSGDGGDAGGGAGGGGY
jgi:hypothetical protein